MLHSRLFFMFILLVALFECSRCRKIDCRDRCCSFVENFPVKLKALRVSYAKIRDYYEANDELETALLDEDILHNIKSPFGCHAMKGILEFYLDNVLPKAIEDVKDANRFFKSPIDSIGNTLTELKRDIIHCRNYLSCRQPFKLDTVIHSYNKMKTNGLYKAMGELDLLFNYIEDYMVSKKRNH
ncbi:interleukin-10 [Chanos chanos]|uniref:Interleukin family protein n=1 Tax=Chanos chanos TaxID=29144 RepID=A0A6J2VK56_CHACN|nr:interleukin-10 [Chanos chanos]